MTQKMGNPAAGDGGVSDCLAGRLDGPDNSHPTPEKQFAPGPDECCYRLGRALKAGRIEPGSWGFDFIRSILRHNKRPGWVPTPKQLYNIRRLVAELTEPADDLIDDGGGDDWAA